MAVWFAHGASYLVGLTGSAFLCWRIWRARGMASSCQDRRPRAQQATAAAAPPAKCRETLTKVLNDGQNLDLNANGYNTLDYGFVGGAEARLGLGRLGVRYDLSLADIYKAGAAVQYGNTALTVQDGKVRNQSIQVYLGIGYRK